jgi:hypothetical protein
MVTKLDTFIQFCEPTYIRSPPIAELWNTLSSFMYCVAAMYFWILINRFKESLPESFPENVVLRYRMCALSWFMLGFGSAAFHAFQTIWAELWDEIGMMVAIVSISYGLVDLHPLTTSRRASWFYASLLTFVSISAGIYIKIMHHPFFAASFMIAAIVPTILVITLPINLNKSVKLYDEVQQRVTRSATSAREEMLRQMKSMSAFGGLSMNGSTWVGISLALLGYAIWHIDQRCVHDKWQPGDAYFYELDWFYWTHPFWHVSTAISTLFFFDSMLKVRVEYFVSPLLRRDLTGSFITRFSFVSAMKVMVGVKREASKSL